MTIAQEEIFGPVLVDHPLRRRGRRRAHRQRHRLRPRRRRVVGRRGAGQARSPGGMRTGQVDVNGGGFNIAGPVRRLQAVGHRPRARARTASRSSSRSSRCSSTTEPERIRSAGWGGERDGDGSRRRRSPCSLLVPSCSVLGDGGDGGSAAEDDGRRLPHRVGGGRRRGHGRAGRRPAGGLRAVQQQFRTRLQVGHRRGGRYRGRDRRGTQATASFPGRARPPGPRAPGPTTAPSISAGRRGAGGWRSPRRRCTRR